MKRAIKRRSEKEEFSLTEAKQRLAMVNRLWLKKVNEITSRFFKKRVKKYEHTAQTKQNSGQTAQAQKMRKQERSEQISGVKASGAGRNVEACRK